MTFYEDPVKLEEISENLGAAMTGINMEEIPREQHMADRGW